MREGKMVAVVNWSRVDGAETYELRMKVRACGTRVRLFDDWDAVRVAL